MISAGGGALGNARIGDPRVGPSLLQRGLPAGVNEHSQASWPYPFRADPRALKGPENMPNPICQDLIPELRPI